MGLVQVGWERSGGGRVDVGCVMCDVRVVVYDDFHIMTYPLLYTPPVAHIPLFLLPPCCTHPLLYTQTMLRTHLFLHTQAAQGVCICV